MERHEIEAAAARHGLRVTGWDSVFIHDATVADFGPRHRVAVMVDGRCLPCTTKPFGPVEFVDLDTALAAIARDIDEIAAVRVRTDTREADPLALPEGYVWRIVVGRWCVFGPSGEVEDAVRSTASRGWTFTRNHERTQFSDEHSARCALAAYLRSEADEAA